MENKLTKQQQQQHSSAVIHRVLDCEKDDQLKAES